MRSRSSNKLVGINLSKNIAWKLISTITLVAILLPIVFVMVHFFSIDQSESSLFSSNLLSPYIGNTLSLVAGVTFLTLVIGITCAWCVTVYDFPFRKYFKWILVMPLAIPTYINAVAYVGLTDFAGPIRILLRSLGSDIYMDVMTHQGAIFFMSLVLYPYVYVAARASFEMQSASLLEVSRSLGKSVESTFFKVVIPLSWPAIFSGLILVIMEVLNDYGVVQYFGIPTFTVGIFRSWLALGDLSTAVILSSMTLLFVIILVAINILIQGRRRISVDKEDRKLSLISPRSKWIVFSICFIPILFGFLIPVFQLTWWAIIASSLDVWADSFYNSINSFTLAILSGIAIVLLSILLTYTYRLSNKTIWSKMLLKLPMMGYAIPGAVIAIGIIAVIVFINPSWVYFGITALIIGYTVRFFAVGFGTVESGFEKIPVQLDQAASSLGTKSLQRLFRVHLPILTPVLIGSFIMVFVDVVKELPLTLILRPFNYETLATDAFQYAKDEMAPKSAASSLLIIFVGSIPVYFLHKILNKKSA